MVGNGHRPPSGSRINPFANLALDRAAERRDDQAWVNGHWRHADSRVLAIDADGTLLTDADGRAPRWLSADERADLEGSLLGLADGRAYFMVRADATLAMRLRAARIDLRRAGRDLSAFEAGLFAYARALAHWQRITRFCTRCGAPLTLISAGHRARCDACGHLHFPRTDPAIIVIVEHQGACLLGRQPSWPEGRYSTLAGFVEPGEALEDAVRREVREESGVEIARCSYHSSQPWPFPASLMLGFTAVAASPAIELRDDELEDARWFTPQAIAEGVEAGALSLPFGVSVSRRLIEDWLALRGGTDLLERVQRAAGAD